MNSREAFDELSSRMHGSSVEQKRLFLFTLQLYLTSSAGISGFEIWFEPEWQVIDPSGVVAGSGTIKYHPKDEDPSAAAKIVSVAADILIGRRVEQIQLDDRTYELRLILDGGLEVRSFVSDPTETEQWLLRDTRDELTLYGNSKGMRVERAA